MTSADLASRAPTPLCLAHEVVVPCADGRIRRYVNLDYAATTPPLREVVDALDAFLPWYSSVHRGSGYSSAVCSAAFDGARQAVAHFVDARDGDCVIFVRSTTEAVNLLAAALPEGTSVLSSPAEHHANMLPWRRHNVSLLPFTRSPRELVDACDEALRRGRGTIELVAVTGASNVTGEVWPLADVAEVAHRHGAEIFVDAAQLAPHRRISMAGDGIDYLALSAHKLYAPFGSGALIARPRRLRSAEPLLMGGGAVKRVTLDAVVWAEPPARFEAGSPNVIGVVALGAACDALSATGMETVAVHERSLTERLLTGLRNIPDLRLLRLWPDASCDRVGVVTFTLAPYDGQLLASVLNAEHAIGVRDGAFCAHPLVEHLVAAAGADTLPTRADAARGAIRASIGIGTSAEDVDVFVAALNAIVDHGPRCNYTYDTVTREYWPTPDLRRWPSLPIRLRPSAPGGSSEPAAPVA